MVNTDRIIPDEFESRNMDLINSDRSINPLPSNSRSRSVNPEVAYGRGRSIGLVRINLSRYVIPNGIHLKHCRKISK